MPQRSFSLYFALIVISLSSLALEISLTRLFSVLFFPPAVFGILSLAILGIGLGAALVTWRAPAEAHSRATDSEDRTPAPPKEDIPRYLAGATLSVVGIVVAAAIPALHLALFGLVLLPYLFIGAALTALFSARPQESPRLYRADLLGAGLGALLAIPLLNWLGGLNAVLAAAVLLSVAGWVLSRNGGVLPEPAGSTLSGTQFYMVLLSGFTLIILISNLQLAWLAVDMSRLPSEKPITSTLRPTGAPTTVGSGETPSAENGTIIDTRWDAFARTDLVDPADGGPHRLYMDGAAGSVMPPAEGADFLWQDIGFFPFATEQPQRIFLIGPGAGLDVWFALQSGAEEIVGVEVNPASIDLVKLYAAYNGDLYGRPQVQIRIDDGRSVLQRDQSHYDLIFLSQLVTLAAERNGYSLVENSSYTIEAFNEFLEHLTPSGQIGIKVYDEPTLTRVLSTALAAFRSQGLTDQEGLQHIIALLDDNVEPPIPLLIISKQPFTKDDALSLGAVAQQVGFLPLFLPGVVAQPPLDGVASGSVPFSDVITNAANDLSPTTDDRPFFFQFERGIPQALQPLLWGALVVVLLGIVLVGMHQRRAAGNAPQLDAGTRQGRLALTPLYFAGLGLGFILVEIGVIQQTRLFLGHPTIAITVALMTLLIGGGIGSGLAGRLLSPAQDQGASGEASQAAPAVSAWPLLAILLLIALWLLLWPVLEDQFAASPLLVRILLVTAALLPLGLVMGMPFPLGLQAVAGWGPGQVPLAWSVNGVMSVVGSILAVTLAVLLGYTIVLLAGGVAYALTAAAVLFYRRRHVPSGKVFE